MLHYVVPHVSLYNIFYLFVGDMLCINHFVPLDTLQMLLGV
jgi:hypothetical protein